MKVYLLFAVFSLHSFAVILHRSSSRKCQKSSAVIVALPSLGAARAPGGGRPRGELSRAAAAPCSAGRLAPGAWRRRRPSPAPGAARRPRRRPAGRGRGPEPPPALAPSPCSSTGAPLSFSRQPPSGRARGAAAGARGRPPPRRRGP